VAMTVKLKMFVWYFKATKSIRSMVWITALAIMRLPRKHAPGVDKAKLLADLTTQICKKEVTMETQWGTFTGNMSMVANLNPNAEEKICSVIVDNYNRNKGREPRIFINAGAHVGRYLVDLTKNFGYTSYGFEPTPETFNYLKLNTIQSGIAERATVFNFGLGDGDEVLEFYQSSNCGFNTFCREQKILNTEAIQVPVKRFDGLDLAINPKDVALVLIDTEGFEFNVLKGMKELLSDMNNVDVIVEIHETSKNTDGILDFMRGMGYLPSPIDSGNWLFRKDVKN
jgi:FkbM family methyltransferase